MTARRLVLWDIDGTLIWASGVSAEAYAAAFHRLTGRALREPPELMNGRTDLGVAALTLERHGIPPQPRLVGEFVGLVVAELVARADLLAHRGRLLPGATEAVDALASVAGIRQSVLTGNARDLAVLKMDVFGLSGYLDFSTGAYGDDAVERTDLLDFAWRRAKDNRGEVYTGADTVLIGDSELDIAAARAGDARAVAVATGTTPITRLAAADVVLPSLTNTDAVLTAILGP